MIDPKLLRIARLIAEPGLVVVSSPSDAESSAHSNSTDSVFNTTTKQCNSLTPHQETSPPLANLPSPSTVGLGAQVFDFDLDLAHGEIHVEDLTGASTSAVGGHSGTPLGHEATLSKLLGDTYNATLDQSGALTQKEQEYRVLAARPEHGLPKRGSTSFRASRTNPGTGFLKGVAHPSGHRSEGCLAYARKESLGTTSEHEPLEASGEVTGCVCLAFPCPST
ncbi:hypothetical protein Dimus_003160 [Dionaea muscipula]